MHTGEAGVQRVVAELLLRNFRPYRPIVDNHGVDLMLDSGLRIQVKTTSLIGNNWKSKSERVPRSGRDAYHFFFLTDKERRDRSGRRIVRKKGSHWSNEYCGSCDYFILVGIDENRFWIVPTFLTQGRSGVVVGPRTYPTKAQIDILVSTGMSQRAAAKSLGVSHSCVAKAVDGRYSASLQWSRAVRQCEDRWDLLTTFEAHPHVADLTPEDIKLETARLESLLALGDNVVGTISEQEK
jgi:hypothetical protein